MEKGCSNPIFFGYFLAESFIFWTLKPTKYDGMSFERVICEFAG